MNNVVPLLEVKARRIGGATYQVPMEVRPERRQTPCSQMVSIICKIKGEKTMMERLSKEILDASNNTGASVKRKKKCIEQLMQTERLPTIDIN